MAVTESMMQAVVEHCKFGKGIIEEVNENHLTVKFEATGDKKVFTYPNAFEKFMKFEKEELQALFAKDWKEHMLITALEDKRKQQEITRMEQENKRALVAMMKKRKKAAQAKAEREKREREKYAKMIS